MSEPIISEAALDEFMTANFPSKPPAPVVFEEPASADLSDLIGRSGVPRLADDQVLARMLRSYDLPDSYHFLSGELRGYWEGQTICIHGSSPDIEDTFPELLELVAAGAKVAAVNKSHEWLVARGITPDFGIMADPKDWVATYQTPQPKTKYLIASQCHDDVFARFKGHDGVFIWHALGASTEAATLEQLRIVEARAQSSGRGGYFTTGGSTTTMRAMDVFSFLGFRHIHFFGVASSGVKKPNGVLNMHGHHKPHVTISQDKMWPLFVKDPRNGKDLAREYFSNGPMQHQALHWETILRQRFEQMRAGTYPITEIVVHGDGLWPACAAMYELHFDRDRASKLRAEGYRETPTPEIVT